MNRSNLHSSVNTHMNGKSKAQISLCLTALSVGISLAGRAMGQEDRPKVTALEEIVVTATRREESLQDTATSIAVVTSDDLIKRGITDFKALSQTTSGLIIDQPSSALSSAVYMRGVGTAGTSAATKSVGILVDGVYQSLPGTAFTELMDINRVEILRGPQGTMFGKNTTAGVIRVFTADPETDQFSGHLQGALGNYDQQEVRGLINVPIIEDMLAMRLSGYTAERDGYVDNVFLGTDARNEDREGWRGKLLWAPTDDLTLKLMAQHDERDNRTTAGLAEYGPTFRAIYGSVAANNPISPEKSQENHQGYVTDDIDRYQASLDWNVVNHTVSLISSKMDAELFLEQDQDSTVLSGHLLNGGLSILTALTDRAEVTHEFQVASDFDDSRWTYVAGYYFQNVESDTAVHFFIPGFGLIARPTTATDEDSNAVFGNVGFDFTDQWNLSVGVRYTEDERAGDNLFLAANGLDTTETFNEVTYALKLRYQMSDDIMLYASHDKGFKSGGVQSELVSCNGRGGRCVDASNALWEPETSYNYEVGMKGEFLDNRIRINSALFFQTYEDFQVAVNYPGESANFVANAAEVESTGIEVEGVALVGDHITLNSSMTYMQTEYTDYANAPCATSTAPGCVNNVQDLTNDTLDHAPEWSFNLGGEYRTGISFGELFARLDLVYRGDQQLSSTPSPFSEEEAYTLVNARIGVEAADSWKVSLWANNLTDEDYLVTATYSLTGLYQTPGQPRMYGVLLDYMF